MKLLRILAIDYGSKKIGLALSDPTGTIASGLMTLDNTRDCFTRIAGIAHETGADLILMGMPLTLKGEFGERAQAVSVFADKLRLCTALNIEMWDERFTSAIAEQARIDAGIRKKGRRDKRKVDEMAAVVLLQSFLESRRLRELQGMAP